MNFIRKESMNLKVVSLIGVSLFSNIALAGKAEVEWGDPKKFTDIEANIGTQKAFQERVMKHLTEQFQQFASTLPEDAVLTVNVKNLDLAGQVEYSFSFMNEFRKVTELYRPEIEFDYKVIQDNKVQLEDSVRLRDMRFLSRFQTRTHKPHHYEKAMLKRWWKQLQKSQS